VEHSLEGPSSRSTTLSRQASKAAQTQEEGGRQAAEGQEKRGQAESQPMKSKKDMKPGYCENCQDKFRDFDEVCHV
jgi:regulatory subunit for Cdc7p protein kinase